MDNIKKEDEICLVSREGDKIIFRKELAQLSDLVNNSELDEDIPVNEISTHILKKIKQFCELHNYDQESMSYKFPFQSDQLKEHVDDKSYQFLEEYDKIDDIEKRIKQLSPLLEAGFYLGFTKFKKIINATIQNPFFCGNTLEDQKNFKEKWNITDEDLTEDVIKEVRQQFTKLHKGYTSALKSELDTIYKDYLAAKKK